MPGRTARIVGPQPRSAVSAPSIVSDSPARSAPPTDLVWLVVALLSGCALMAPLLNAGPLALDEHGSYWLVSSDLPGTSLQRSLDHAAIPPLSAWLEQAFLAACGKSEFVFRLPSPLCYLAAIVVTWLVGSQLAGRTAGGVAALLLAWHPDVDEVRIARCYGLLMLLAALLLWCTVQWRRTPGSRMWPLAWGCAAAGLMWTHYVALLLIGVVWLTLHLRTDDPQQKRIRLPTTLLAGALAALLCLPLAPAILRLREWSPFLNYMPEGQPWWQTLGPLWWAGAPAGLLAAALMRLVGRPAAVSLRRALLPALWTLLPLLCLALLARGDMSSLANPRYQIPYAAGGACLIAVLLAALAPRPWAAVLGAFTVIGLTWSLSDAAPWQLRRLGAPADVEWRNASLLIQQTGVPGEPVFVQSGLVESHLVPAFYDDPLFLEYVGCRISRFYLEQHHPRIGMPYFWDNPPELSPAFRRMMSPASADRESFWIAAATDTDLNQASLAGLEQLARAAGFDRIIEQRGPNMTILRYQRSVESP